MCCQKDGYTRLPAYSSRPRSASNASASAPGSPAPTGTLPLEAARATVLAARLADTRATSPGSPISGAFPTHSEPTTTHPRCDYVGHKVPQRNAVTLLAIL